MSNVLGLGQHFLALLRSYGFLPLGILLLLWAGTYNVRLLNAARADTRNSGSGYLDTMRLAHLIYYERRLKRDPATVAIIVGFPLVFGLLILSSMYG